MLHVKIYSWLPNFILISQVVGMLIGVITFLTLSLETDAAAVVEHLSDSQLQVCADTQFTPDRGQVAIFWKSDEHSNCSYVKASGPKEPLETATALPIDGFWLLHVNPMETHNLTVKCRKSDSQAQKGTVQFQLDQNFSSKECISADWLKKTPGPNFLTICSELWKQQLTRLSWNATTPLEECFFINESAESNSSTAIHVLPHNVFLNLEELSRNSRFFVHCVYPPSGESYTSGPVSYSSEKICSTKVMDIHQDSSDDGAPKIAPIHQAFVSKHVGLFVTFIVATLVVIGIFILFAFRRIRRERWRQGQRLLVNEESDDAALREYQEMAT